MISGVTQLIMTKSDVFDLFDSIKICTAYLVDDKETNVFPYELNDNVKPLYKEFKGWKTKIAEIRKYEELPTELTNYIKFIEDYVKIPVKIISVGPDREETIIR
jgi:adenylosuccinate synthase